ncbi:DUF2157 domain-containing protein [Dyadobacter sp. Leaf189]|uniref:DUF2157 domain-containing protein n=1 Tax=Dyadobacter sp. Leaf189 TaxID=1736295 RepID=UPI0006F5A29D|nr:DUF2157 domain-containing protein [Dyadobacter sp. Leaf189]KQS26945.1 hypothetical protein ASG33_20630 [Dyadobacter sp. Leaf189]
MTTTEVLNALTSKGIISNKQADTIHSFEADKAFSIHWELRSILYLGILLFTSGLGILIYENIDTIGHQAIIALIAILMVICFWYTYKHRVPFSLDEVHNPNKFVSYTLLIGCMLFLALEGYLQFQYTLFGTKYGAAVLLPTLLFFVTAYRFDHTGVLSMAITGLASWLGLTIAPLSVIAKSDFTDGRLVWSATLLGVLLVAFAWISNLKSWKAHFANTYLLLGGNLAFIATLAGAFTMEPLFVFFLFGITLAVFFILSARRVHSLLFLLMGIVYGYVHVTYLLAKLVGNELVFGLATVYFTFSSIGVILFLLNYKKFLGIKR